MIEIQCTSCHTRYRIDEQVLPEGIPTFKCSRCGHVFSFEPRAKDPVGPESADQDVRAAQARTAGAAENSPDNSQSARSMAQKLGALKTELPIGGRRDTPAAEDDSDQAKAPSGVESASFRAWQAAHGEAEETDAGVKTPDMPQTRAPAESGQAAPRRAGREEGTQSANASTREEDRLARPFAHAVHESESGENLAFDFNDEQSEPSEPGEPNAHLAPDDSKWQVGDSQAVDFDDGFGAARDRDARGPREMRAGAADMDAPRRRTRRQRKRPLDEEFVDEGAAPLYNRTATHSSRLFLGLFLAAAVAYGLLTLLIRSAPVAASEVLSHVPMIGERFVPPITPASLVALRNVSSNYEQVKGGHSALVITGEAQNVADSPLHVVQVAVNLRDATQRALASQAVYCGNNLAHKMVGEMTPHEIEFFQKLDPPKSFALAAADKCPFMLVLIDPPAGVARFDISVAKAIPAEPAAEAGAPSNF